MSRSCVVSPTIEHLATERLRIDRLHRSDEADMRRMHAEASVMRTLGGVRSDEQTRDYVQKNLEHWERYGYGLWILRSRDDGQFMGRSAIRHVHVGGNDEIEIGYGLMPEHWGHGFATEAARALVTLAFTSLSLVTLVAFTLIDNLASRRVMIKAGGTYERDIIHAGRPHALYRFSPPRQLVESETQ
jgi:ribosomal-protein-alanine N-acetyltransferase